MVLTIASTWHLFRKAAPDGEANTNEWHAYSDDGNVSMCGEAQLAYNVDPIADAVPSGDVLHPGCEAALTKRQSQAEAASSAEAETEAEPATGEVLDLNEAPPRKTRRTKKDAGT